MTGNDADDAKKAGKDLVSHQSGSESEDSTTEKSAKKFEGPYQPADLDYYSKFPVWNHLELACLSMGYDPGPLLKADAKALQTCHSKFTALEKRLHLIQRACDATTLSNPTPPLVGLRWLESVSEDIPDRAIALCARYTSELEPVPYDEVKSFISDIDVRMATVEQKLQTDNLSQEASGAKQKIDSLQRTLLGMACDKYEFDPTRDRNPTARMIAGATQLIGKDVDEGTVRTHLAAAVKRHLDDSIPET